MKEMTGKEMILMANRLFEDEFDKTMFITTECLHTINRFYDAGKTGKIDKSKFAAFVMVIDKNLPRTSIELMKIKSREDADKAYDHIKATMPILMGLNDLIISEGILS